MYGHVVGLARHPSNVNSECASTQSVTQTLKIPWSLGYTVIKETENC